MSSSDSGSIGQREGGRAPLATFDTVDFGEDRSSIRTLQNDSIEMKSEIDSPNSEISSPFDFSSYSEDCTDSVSSSSQKPDKQNNDIWTNISIKTGTIDSEHKKLSKRNSFGYQNLKEKRTSISSDSSDSSDSERGYVRSGYVTVTSNSDKFSNSPFGHPFDSPYPQRAFLKHIEENNSSCESTPFSSPNLSYISRDLPSLIEELENVTEKSKRKALEKKIQRLQVTNKPVERPRSTTPINVVNFEEYKSPTSSPSINSEKLSIKLPHDECRKRHKSPLKLHGDIFTFNNEELLFTRTKALVVETPNQPWQSPKRVLIPPTLSPSCSPVKSENKSSGLDAKPMFSTSPDNWVAFPNDISNLRENDNQRDYHLPCDNNDEDLITVRISESDNEKTCDISLEAKPLSDKVQLVTEINSSESNKSLNENLHSEQNDEMTFKEADTSDLRKEIISIVNEIFDGESSMPQVFQEGEETSKQEAPLNRMFAKDENTQNAPVLLS